MPLALYDQNRKVITERTPIMTEHNGTAGEEVTVNLHLINEDKGFRYDDIVIKVKAKKPVTLRLVKITDPAAPGSRIDFKRLRYGEVANFKAIIKVPEDTKASFIRGSILDVKWKKYPV